MHVYNELQNISFSQEQTTKYKLFNRTRRAFVKQPLDDSVLYNINDDDDDDGDFDCCNKNYFYDEYNN